MVKKILVIKAHPALNTYNEALTNEYIKGARESKNQVKEISLRELKLERFLKHDHKTPAELSDDLLKAQKLIKWADHLVFAYPIWWGTAPSLLREFIEIVLTSGFAFEYSKKGMPIGLLQGKSARIIATMDSPKFYYNLMLGNPDFKLMKKCVLGFCGIVPIKKSYFGSVKMATEGTRNSWAYKAYEIGKAEFK